MDANLQEVLWEFLERMRDGADEVAFRRDMGLHKSNYPEAMRMVAKTSKKGRKGTVRPIPIEWAIKVGDRRNMDIGDVFHKLAVIAGEVKAKKETGTWVPPPRDPWVTVETMPAPDASDPRSRISRGHGERVGVQVPERAKAAQPSLPTEDRSRGRRGGRAEGRSQRPHR